MSNSLWIVELEIEVVKKIQFFIPKTNLCIEPTNR